MSRWTFHHEHRILLLLFGGVGDVLLFTPALEALAKEFPGIPIDAVVRNNGGERILKFNPHINQLIIYNWISQNRTVQKFNLLKRIIKGKYTISITHCVDFDYKTGLVALLSGAKKRIGPDIRPHSLFYNLKVPMPEDQHFVHRNYLLVRKAGVKQPLDETLQFFLGREEKTYAEQFMDHSGIKPSHILIGIHPGGGLWRTSRRWPKENFRELILRLINQPHIKILLMGGPSEREMVNEMENEIGPPILVADKQLTLGEFGALIQRCHLFVCNDGGPLQMAAAVGTPTMVVVGPTNIKAFAPLGGQHTIIRKPLPCSPCIDYYNYQSDACSELTCLKTISVLEVFNTIMDKVNNLDMLCRHPVPR